MPEHACLTRRQEGERAWPIFGDIRRLKELSDLGIATHAEEIAQLIIRMSATIKLHLSIEDRFLYPALQEVNDRRLPARASSTSTR